MSGESRSLVCIECPRGCRLTIAVADGAAPEASGNGCKRGADYAVRELTCPTRSLTTTVRTTFPALPRLPVRTRGEIPKSAWREAMAALRNVTVDRPVKVGEPVLEDLLGLGVAVVATAAISTDAINHSAQSTRPTPRPLTPPSPASGRGRSPEVSAGPEFARSQPASAGFPGVAGELQPPADGTPTADAATSSGPADVATVPSPLPSPASGRGRSPEDSADPEPAQIQPASAGFVDIAGGFSPRANAALTADAASTADTANAPTPRRSSHHDEAVLAIDCGTQSLRALIFDATGRLLAREKVEYEPYFSTAPGRAEQDAEVYWRALVEACRKLRENNGALLASVRGVGVTTQRDTVICLDSAGNPVRPAILWLDQRRAEPSWRPNWLIDAAFRAAGMSEAVRRTQEANRVAWIRQHEPELWGRTAQVVQVSGFLNRRLTGEPADSVASQIGHMPFDFKKQRWAASSHLNARLFPLEPERLPRLLQPGETLGRLTAKAAEEAGLPAGLPVVACGSDKGCETIGMGVVDTAMAALSFGTTATVQTTSGRYFEPISYMPAYPALVPGCFNPEVEIFRGYWMITWFKNQFAHAEVEEARRRNLAPELMLDELLRATPPGAMGLVLQPYWSPGLKNPSAKGGLIGFGDVHTRAHVYRAVIEGLAFGLLDGLEAIERRSGQRTTRLTVAGGASQSDEICQIAADVFGRPLVRGCTHESSGLGAAMATAAGLGLHRSVPAAIAAMKSYQYEFLPRPEASAVYRELYERVYRRMDGALGPLYREIREIVNYPEREG